MAFDRVRVFDDLFHTGSRPVTADRPAAPYA